MKENKFESSLQQKTDRVINGGFRDPKSLTAAVIQKIAERIDPEEVAQTILNLMKAEKMVRTGRDECKRVPDSTAREAGAKLYLSYMVGLPIQRQEVVTVQHETMETIQEKLEISPAFRKALRDLLDHSEKKVEPASPSVTPNPQ